MNLYEQLCDWPNLWRAWENASRGKRRRGATALFELYLGDHLLELERALKEKTYQPGCYSSFYIHDPKKRLISAAPFRDRVVHHALCNVTVPYFERKLIYHTYANRVGKGTHRALDYATQCARRSQFVLQCDIRQYFPSIDHAILFQTLAELLPDDSLAWLLERILHSGVGVLAEEYEMVYFPKDDLFSTNRPRGLPIGNLTSQIWANCYLSPFDQFVKRDLKCKDYLRYVDDFLLFSNDKTQLWEWRMAIIAELARYRLTLHERSATPYPVAAGIPFLGFRIYPAHRLLKRKKGIAYRRRLCHLLKTADAQRVSASIQAWKAHISHGDTFGLSQAVFGR